MSNYDAIEQAYKNGYEAGKRYCIADLRQAVNELCLQCGRYKMEYIGSCDNCKWERVKKDFAE